MKIRHVLETCLYAEDLVREESFYSGVLGLEVQARESGRHVFFRLPHGMLLIFNPRVTEHPGLQGHSQIHVPAHGATGAQHVAFAVHESALPAWRSHLHAKGVAIEKEVAWPGGGHSIYFRDPAGHSVELATPRLWQMPEGQVFG